MALTISQVPEDVRSIVVNHVSIYGLRGERMSAIKRAAALIKMKRFDTTLIHTHCFRMEDISEAIRYAKDRVDDAIKVMVPNDPYIANQQAIQQDEHNFLIY